MARALVVQDGDLRITVLSQIQPYKLPRKGVAPINVFVAGHVGTRSGQTPPQLNRMTVKLSRHGQIHARGLPLCGIRRLEATTTEQALENCSEALVGSGQFWAHILLPGQEPYPTRGRLLIFNGRSDGGPALLAHIFTSNPFNASFVFAFKISHIRRGGYGTKLSASFPEALGSWGYVDRIKLTMRRHYRYRGRLRSYLNAGCPAPPGVNVAVYPLAYVGFYFAGRHPIGTAISKTCMVKR